MLGCKVRLDPSLNKTPGPTHMYLYKCLKFHHGFMAQSIKPRSLGAHKRLTVCRHKQWLPRERLTGRLGWYLGPTKLPANSAPKGHPNQSFERTQLLLSKGKKVTCLSSRYLRLVEGSYKGFTSLKTVGRDRLLVRLVIRHFFVFLEEDGQTEHAHNCKPCGA